MENKKRQPIEVTNKQLESAMKEMSLSRKDIANKVGVGSQAVANWLQDSRPSVENIERLVLIFGKRARYWWSAPQVALVGNGKHTPMFHENPHFEVGSIVRCIYDLNKKGVRQMGLTTGKKYTVIEDRHPYVVVVDDYGAKVSFVSGRFAKAIEDPSETVVEERKKTIELTPSEDTLIAFIKEHIGEGVTARDEEKYLMVVQRLEVLQKIKSLL